MGTYAVEKLDVAGNLLWSFMLSDSAEVLNVECDAAGNTFIGGSFMGTMSLNGTSSMQNLQGGWYLECFIIKLSPGGSVIWNKNISSGNGNFVLRSMAVDRLDNFWYSLSDFNDARIIKTDVTGFSTDSFPVAGAKWVSSFGFDSNGDLYACGATENGQFSVGGMSVTVIPSYAYFIFRMNDLLQTQWIKIASAQTFHSPRLVVNNGSAFMASNIIDSLTWDGIHFRKPQWSQDFFLVHFDAAGNATYGIQSPLTTTITGRLTLAPNKCLALDSNDNVIVYGLLNGTIDWGNSVTGDAGVISQGKFHLVSYDPNGIALWQNTFGGTSGNYPGSVAGGTSDVCYVAEVLTNDAQFDTITCTIPTGQQTFNLAKVNLNSSPVLVSTLTVKNQVLFPNPAMDRINIPASWVGEQIEIYNSTMQRVHFFKAEKIQVDLNLHPGLYFFKNKNVTYKLIVN